jgi:hypothetical protein
VAAASARKATKIPQTGGFVMMNRKTIRRFSLILGLTLALWVAGASRANAQCDIDVFSITETEGPPSVCLGSETVSFSPGSNSHTFVFDPNNSIKITATINNSVDVTVEQWQITQAEYQSDRRDNVHFPNSTCWETGGPGLCIFYRVHTFPNAELVGLVNYIVGFTTPAVKGNKHDLMLLRSEDDDGIFDTEIATRVLRNYQVGDDPGVGGFSDGFSDYIVAFEIVRPASK